MIFLYGPSGSGKSTVGRVLAEALQVPFLDLDNAIEVHHGQRVEEIFALQGEAAFRQMERDLLFEWLAGHQDGVVALGGGALLQKDVRVRVEGAGEVVLLHASVEVLAERLLSDQENPRPLLAGGLRGRLKALIARRDAHYRSFPLQVDTEGRTPDEVAWEIQVRLGRFYIQGMGRGYDVRIQAGGLGTIGTALHRLGLGGPVAVVADERVAEFYAARVEASLQQAGLRAFTIAFPPGEAHKTLTTLTYLWTAMLQNGLDRRSTVVALGGGVTTDLAGFAAATFMRGLPWIAVPTSLLGMVDASLGGKTGFDLPQGKNLIGAFHPPRMVLADPDVLHTLPFAEFRSGMAEVVKHGVIGDPQLFARCGQPFDHHDRATLTDLIRRAAAVKVKVIQQDPYEQGVRAALNLGHTIGHGVEAASNYTLRHGEAVAIGMVAEARLAEDIGLAANGLHQEIAETLSALRLPTAFPADLDRKAVIQAMRQDKKRRAGQLRFALPMRVGKVQTGVTVPDWPQRMMTL